MLGILLMILKVIGWLLLAIIGLILFLVCLVLFVPIPYRVWVSGAPENDPVFVCRVKIFGLQVFPRKNKKKKKQPAAGTALTGADHTEQKESSEATGNATGNIEVKNNTEATETAETIETTKASDTTDTIPSKKQEKKFSKSVIRTSKRIWAELTDEHNKRALLHVLRELKCLLHHIGPRRIRADASFSLGDPANTGYATAVLSICPFVYGKKCRIEPDFVTEDLYVKGWMDVCGHVCLIHVLLGGLRLLFDKDIRRIIKKLRR